MQIFEWDDTENLLKEITEIVGEEKLKEFGVYDNEDLIKFALNFLLSKIQDNILDDIEDYFYEVE